MPPATYRGNPSTGKGPGCRPPSPLSSATRLRQSVGAGHARPAASPFTTLYPLHRREGFGPLDGAQRAPSASKAGPLMRLFALQGQTLFAPRFRSAQPWAHAHNPAPPRGVGDTAPYNNPQGFSLPQTSAAAWGQAALHPTLPHSVGRAFARNSFTPLCRGRACPARNPAITTPYPLHRRAASHRGFA